jgi:hypothetical protein
MDRILFPTREFPIGKSDVELFDKVISTNLRGTFLVLAQAAQHIATGGKIIAFSSSVLAKSFPTYGPYIAPKAGVQQADSSSPIPRRLNFELLSVGSGQRITLFSGTELQIFDLDVCGSNTVVFTGFRQSGARPIAL